VTDAEIVARSLEEGEVFAVLFDRHFRAIHRFLRGRAGVDLADEITSETFAIAFRKRGAYDLSCDDARPWLYGIAVNLLRECRRGEARRLRAYARSADGSPLEAPDPERDGSMVDAALRELGEQERTLILLHAWAGLSYEQLAQALDVPIGTVRSRLSRVREKLRAALELHDRAVAITERNML
jgi:RNA polymerase sigma-70 factor (ECF subfamily)